MEKFSLFKTKRQFGRLRSKIEITDDFNDPLLYGASNKLANKVGWFASIMALLMFFSYIDQIMRNLSGHKGSWLLAAATVINCLSWVCYGSLKEKPDWPIISCNAFGLIVAIVAAITSI